MTESEASPKSIIKCACGGWYKDMMKTIYEDWETRAEDFDSLFEYASKFEDFDDFLASVTLEINEAEGNAGESAGRGSPNDGSSGEGVGISRGIRHRRG